MARQIYVTSDLHGHFNKFIKLLRCINFDETDKMLILGNVVNGGPQPIDLLFFISQQENIRMCLGLHEIIMLQSLLENDLEMFNEWINNIDGKYTYETFNKLSNEKKHYILNYLKESCPSFFTTENFFLCSNGPKIWEENKTTNLKTERPSLEEFLNREDNKNNSISVDMDFYQKAGLSDKITIFGGIAVQQIRQNKNYKIWHDPIYHDKICINSGVGIKPYKLSCLRLNDLSEFYV